MRLVDRQEAIRQYLLEQIQEQNENPIIKDYLVHNLHSLEIMDMRSRRQSGVYKKYEYKID